MTFLVASVRATVVAVLLVAGLSSPASAARTSVSQRPDCPRASPVAAGIFVVDGSGGSPKRSNRGRVGNTVILRGDTGLVIVDPGPTLQSGRAIACSARRLGGLPVVALVNTHPHPENVLANAAFGGVTIYAAASAVDAMRERCRRCEDALARVLGRQAMAGTRALIPDAPVALATSVSPGGRTLRLIPLGIAHSPGDLAIVDDATGTLIGGDIAAISELPDLRDGTTLGAIEALERLQAMHPRLIVPGRGRPFAPELLARPLAYLKRLHAAATLSAESGEWPPSFANEREYAKQFSRFDELHPLNLQHAYREAEAEWWQKPPAVNQTPAGAAGN